MANMPTADAVLVSYPAYNAWPMAAKIKQIVLGFAAHSAIQLPMLFQSDHG